MQQPPNAPTPKPTPAPPRSTVGFKIKTNVKAGLGFSGIFFGGYYYH